MYQLQEEKQFIHSFKKKLVSNNDLTREELFKLCTQFEDTVELASVSMKIINRLRTNYSKLANP